MTLGCFIWYKSVGFSDQAESLLPLVYLPLVCGPTLIMQRAELTKPMKFPGWNAQSFFTAVAFLFATALFMILAFNLPGGRLLELFGRWYYLGTFWLLLLCLLALGFINEKEKARQQSEQAASDGVLSDEASS
ncbi:MAG TPA: hypothetical protein PLO37_05585 [Candidatus Hydrogenedentes bacterium]|nr:hypothetical protein [Candidatus Hydrogenedentota bacterium]HPG66299.1 hypothetical protein [Candidatus Hydrogenedentota bacterium]